MSRTKQPQRPGAADYYPTPSWCVDRLFEVIPCFSGQRWLEPAVGDGAIVRAVDQIRPGIDWTTVDIRGGTQADVVGDFTSGILGDRRYDVAITNPPYNQAMAFVEECRRIAKVTIMLLRLNWLASIQRQAFLSDHMPDVYVLPNRPSFTGGGTDACEYAWMVWWLPTRRTGMIRVLDTTPIEERRP